jgi:hypothetical protein
MHVVGAIWLPSPLVTLKLAAGSRECIKLRFDLLARNWWWIGLQDYRHTISGHLSFGISVGFCTACLPPFTGGCKIVIFY